MAGRTSFWARGADESAAPRRCPGRHRCTTPRPAPGRPSGPSGSPGRGGRPGSARYPLSRAPPFPPESCKTSIKVGRLSLPPQVARAVISAVTAGALALADQRLQDGNDLSTPGCVRLGVGQPAQAVVLPPAILLLDRLQGFVHVVDHNARLWLHCGGGGGTGGGIGFPPPNGAGAGPGPAGIWACSSSMASLMTK